MHLMADQRHIAVFDAGKTSCKLVLLNGGDYAEIEVLRQEFSVLQGPPYPHLDIDAMWSFLCDSLATFETKYGIDALAITTHACTAGLVDADELVLPILDYEYEIPPELATEYDDLRPAFEKTFSPRMPGGLNLGAQLHFLRATFPKEYAKCGTLFNISPILELAVDWRCKVRADLFRLSFGSLVAQTRHLFVTCGRGISKEAFCANVFGRRYCAGE